MATDVGLRLLQGILPGNLRWVYGGVYWYWDLCSKDDDAWRQPLKEEEEEEKGQSHLSGPREFGKSLSLYRLTGWMAECWDGICLPTERDFFLGSSKLYPVKVGVRVLDMSVG